MKSLNFRCQNEDVEHDSTYKCPGDCPFFNDNVDDRFTNICEGIIYNDFIHVEISNQKWVDMHLTYSTG